MRTQAEWNSLPTSDQYDWIAYFRRKRKRIESIAKHISTIADGDDKFTVEKATYVALLTIAQELM